MTTTTATIEPTLLELLADCGGLGVPAADLDEMAALTKAGEPGVALENLCEQLFEYDVKMPAAVVERVEVLGTAMGLQPNYWTRFDLSAGSPRG